MSNLKWPTLYKLTSAGKTQMWEISVQNLVTHARIIVTHGQLDGKKQVDEKDITVGKNIGKSNETTPYEQARSEATSDWKKKKDKGYTENLSVLTQPTVYSFKPMLAHKWTDHAKKAVFPGYVQPKLDGCLTGDAMIKTKEYGYKPIKWLVDNKINCHVWSRNKSGKLEYKKIKYHFLNKEIKENVEWFEICLETGEKLILTGNHEVFLPELNCWRRTDELIGNEKLMVLDK